MLNANVFLFCIGKEIGFLKTYIPAYQSPLLSTVYTLVIFVKPKILGFIFLFNSQVDL